MNILGTLSIKSLKLNKKRTISTVIGIILSVALICAASTMFTSFRETLIQETINDSGYWHFSISGIENNKIDELSKSKDIKNIDRINFIGYSILEDSKNVYKPYLRVLSMDESSIKNLRLNLIEGRLPQNNKEVIISEHIKTNGKVELKIGDKLELDVGKRMSIDGYELSGSNYYDLENGEKLDNTEKMEFTIVGIISRPTSGFESYSDPGYTIITTNLNKEESLVYVTLKNATNYKKTIPSTLGFKDYDEFSFRYYSDYKYDVKLNDELLRWEAFKFSDSTVTMLMTVLSIVIGIIVFTSVFCIRNSFAVATTEKTKMYGMLASVGATKKQIKGNVIFEALILGIIGIPLGILGGIFAVYVLIYIVNKLLVGIAFNVEEMKVKVSLIPIIISTILGFVTIYLSAISSARRASKVSPIDSLRSSQDIKINPKKLSTPKIISKLFGMGGVLAHKNLRRSKKKYRATVVSLAVSIFVFISMNSFITSAFGFSDRYYKEYDYNVNVSGLEDVNKDDMNKILDLDNIKNYTITYYPKGRYIEINDLSMVNQNEENDEFNEDAHSAYMQVIILDDNDFKEYTKKAKINYDNVKDSGILVDDYEIYDQSSNSSKAVRKYKYKGSDVIKGIFNGNEISIKVHEVSKTRPRGMESTYSSNGFIILNKIYYENSMDIIPDYMVIQSNNSGKLTDDIENLKLDARAYNLEEYARANNAMKLVISIFLYGFIAVITLIGVTNIFNTITSNMELRQREFATLKSIGMTKREFNKMINLETIFYSVKALIYGIILGLLGTFGIYKAFSIKIDSGIYIPYIPIIISIIFVFVLVYVIMKYSMNRINRQNVIETIRNENI